MSYTPTNWSRGDVVTSAKLNKLENGVAEASGSGGGGVLLVNANVQTGTLDKTWQKIHDAAPLVWMEDKGGYLSLIGVYEDEGDYGAIFNEPQTTGNNIHIYIATSADGYPSKVEEDPGRV